MSSENKPKDLTNFLDETGARYIELQYHGELNLNFIKEICFAEDLPDESILKRLKEKNIKLFKIEGDYRAERIIEI